MKTKGEKLVRTKAFFGYREYVLFVYHELLSELQTMRRHELICNCIYSLFCFVLVFFVVYQFHGPREENLFYTVRILIADHKTEFFCFFHLVFFDVFNQNLCESGTIFHRLLTNLKC